MATEAQDAFWAVFAAVYPVVKTGVAPFKARKVAMAPCSHF